MTRQLHGHKANPANDKLKIEVIDQPGSGGAHHEYMVTGFDLVPGLPSHAADIIRFQNGPINEAGINGLTHEVLLEIVIDRLRCFQAGPFACRENALALTKIEEAQHWLLSRTRTRMDRGVEGTNKK